MNVDRKMSLFMENQTSTRVEVHCLSDPLSNLMSNTIHVQCSVMTICAPSGSSTFLNCHSWEQYLALSIPFLIPKLVFPSLVMRSFRTSADFNGLSRSLNYEPMRIESSEDWLLILHFQHQPERGIRTELGFFTGLTG